MTRPRDYKPGDNVPGTVYRVVRLIGAGGMGTVYDVEDTTVGKRYVLKTLHAELHKREDLAERMVKEARQLARVSHPNIVEVVTAGATTDDLKLPYYVMEKLNGQSLHTILNKKGSLELPHAMHIAIDLLDALDNAHDKGVIHRDVKPENIFLHINPNGLTTTKLLDFGIMRVLDEPGVTAGRFMGTLRYAAPEQLRGDTPMPQTDIYAAALVLYEMIAGHGPFDEEGDSSKIAAAHLSATPPPMMHWGVVVPEVLERLVRGALSKDPLKRPKDAFTFASQLRNMNRALAAERPAASETSRPTAVPVLGPGADPPSEPRARQVSASGPVSGVAASTAAFAATEHAATRAGTPEAKAPATTPRPEAPATDSPTTGQTVMGMTAPPSGGPTLMDLKGRGEEEAHTLGAQTERQPGLVDRGAATQSASGPVYPAPRGDGSTEPMPVVSASEWRAPATLRMSAAPVRASDDAASDLLARFPPHESAIAPTDGAASSTVTPRVNRVRPVVAVAIGVTLTLATAATLSLVVWGIRSRLSAAQPQPATATEAPVAPEAPVPSASPVAAPTIPPPLDLPPASATPAASPVPVAPVAPATPTAAPGVTADPQPVRPRPSPTTRVAPPPAPLPPSAPQNPPPARRKLPSSGL